MSKRAINQPDTDIKPKKAKFKSKVSRLKSRDDYKEDDSDLELESEIENSGPSGDNFTSSIIEDSRILTVKKQGSMISNENALPGVILRVSMNNFMCHNHLEVNFGTHVNYVVGRNGSGKSAIITALVVGLGGKASVTNRGSSIKNFVKTGKRSSWVEVCLNNKTKDAYKPEVYGDKIIIRRRFTVDGISSYSIAGASGKVVTEKKDELSRITENMNIQVDNPVSILNQDTSRNFLNTKSSSDKFKFFMKATQLEQMNADYDLVRKNKELTRQILSSKETTLPKMKSEVKEWENKVKNLTAISVLKDKVKDLKHEAAWAYVISKEKVLHQTEKSMRTEEAAIPKFTKKVDEAKENMTVVDGLHKQMEEKLIQSEKEVQKLQPMLQQTRKALCLAKEKLAPIQNQVTIIDREMRCTKQECRQCEERIEELKSMASHDFEASRREREEKIVSLESKKDELSNEQGIIELDLDQLRNAVAKYKADIGGLESQLKSKQGKLRETKTAIQNLNSSRDNYLHKFGYWTPDVVAKVKAMKRQFHHLPRGPLGAEFQLKDQKWALALECCFKNLITAFIVNDHHDEKLLEEIFNSSNCPRTRRPPIITCAFSNRTHDVRSTRVKDSRFPCILDIIQCGDPVIINTLIDQRTIENVLLIEDSNEARNVMMRDPPKAARECFTLTGDQAYCVPTFRYYSSDKSSVRYLMANVDEQIAALTTEMNNLETSIKEITKERARLQREIQKNQSEEKKRQTQLNKVTGSINRTKFEITELQNIEDPAPVDVTTLEDEVEAYKVKIKELQDKKVTIEADKRVADEEMQATKEKHSKVETDIRELSDGEILIREEMRQAHHKVDKAKNELKHYVGKLKEQEKRIDTVNKEVSALRETCESNVEKALQISARINTQRKANDIETEITQFQKRIEKEEEQHGNEDETREICQKKKSGLARVVREVSELKHYTEKLDEVMKRRRDAYDKMRKLIGTRIKHHFAVQMSLRDFRGHLEFNFEKQTLDIIVNTSSTKATDKSKNITKDLKSLSGGERSFSTVCFILSLWEAMESPFRCLDEFDVFMDMVNRRISMDMMMETADMHKNLQFVFLTPQDMSSVRKISNVKIFRMPDPERSQNQTVLSFSQA